MGETPTLQMKEHCYAMVFVLFEVLKLYIRMFGNNRGMSMNVCMKRKDLTMRKQLGHKEVSKLFSDGIGLSLTIPKK